MITAIYADGGVIGPNPSKLGGTWAWCAVNDRQEPVITKSGLLLPGTCGLGEIVTNNHSEFFALGQALRAMSDLWEGHVYSDSRISLGRIFEGWKNENVPLSWVQWAAKHRRRLGDLEWTLLDGHPTKAQLEAGTGKRGNPVSVWNQWCDKECSRLAREYREEHP